MSTTCSVANSYSSIYGLQTIRSSSGRRSSYRPSSTVDLAAATQSISTCHFLGDPRLRSLNTSLQNGTRTKKMDVMKVNDNLLPDVPPVPTNPSDPGSWKIWLAGIFFSVIIPFWKNKWGPLQKLQQKVEEVVDTAQKVTDIVEDVAEEVEKVADKFGDSLPQGGKLQQAAQFVEDMANQTVKNVNMLEDVLEQVEEVENQVEDFLEDQMNESKQGTNDEKKAKDEKITQEVKPGTV